LLAVPQTQQLLHYLQTQLLARYLVEYLVLDSEALAVVVVVPLLQTTVVMAIAVAVAEAEAGH
jgi:hypothetical protein